MHILLWEIFKSISKLGKVYGINYYTNHMSPTSHNNGLLQQKNILLPQYAQKKDMTSSSKANQPKDMVKISNQLHSQLDGLIRFTRRQDPLSIADWFDGRLDCESFSPFPFEFIIVSVIA
ncbi:uncharacterized protein LOC119646577 [Hermetia illucens]|uniref:uncharacterized protein LOC119646577 n=1 Tax=Hermetia illucens TaxID=343691 RepID=UPI0018CC10CE|nr:uncharacterized protein LOC119646577 [Hermetia illucens]